MKLRVPKQDRTVGSLFRTMEKNKEDYDIQDYSISETTLEQIFHEFAQGSDKNDQAIKTYRVIKMDKNNCLYAVNNQDEEIL